MRTILTVYDIKEMIRQLFNGNKEMSEVSSIPYSNPNSEDIVLVDEYDGSQTAKDLAKYLDITFYAWKDRLVSTGANHFEAPKLSTYGDWVQSLNFSTNKAYALVEVDDEAVTASQDIDSATKSGKVSILIQEDKVENLDYYVSKIRNSLLGVPQDIQGANGQSLKAYINIGTLLYDGEPETIQLGEVLQVSFNFSITYLTSALTYDDIQVELSLNGDIESEYKPVAITQSTWQNIFTSVAYPTYQRPDLTGFVVSSVSTIKTLTFYDFDKALTQQLNAIFWRTGSYKMDGALTPVQEVNIPVFIRVKTGGHTYVYKDIIDTMQKNIRNSDFVTSTITLKGFGKASL